MTPLEMLWFLPLVLVVSVVVGASGRRGHEIAPAVARAFLGLTLAILGVGLAVHLVVRFLA